MSGTSPQPRRVLVTGGAGFIGSHLSEALLARGDQVIVLDDQSTGVKKNLSTVLEHPSLKYVAGSVGDRLLVRTLVGQVDLVCHLAAAVGVKLIADSPIDSIERNIAPVELLLSELLEANQGGRPVQLFLASSSEVYGKNPREVWCEDDDIVLGPTRHARWSYGASKAIDEFLALAYYRQFGLPVVIGRFFNVVGPRQRGEYGMVLPRFIRSALAGEPLLVHDDGQQVRCFAHVADVCQMVLALVDSAGSIGEVFNVGSDEPISILQLAEKVVAAVGGDAEIAFESYRDAYSADFEDVRRRVPDLSKLRHTVDFQPRYDIDATIADAVRWQREQGPLDKP